jgi:hypothetical protein
MMSSMRRLARPLFTLGSALSLLLCVATGVLWTRSQRHVDLIRGQYVRSPQPDECHSLRLNILSFSGTLRFELTRIDYGPAYLRGQSAGWMEAFHEREPAGLHWERAGDRSMRAYSFPPPGFFTAHYVDTRFAGERYDLWVLAVRPWLPMAVLLVMPAIWLHRFRKARRARRLGLCPACGYDLRASPERCPECGALPRPNSCGL